jgi:HEPN domain-containing protein
MLFQKLPSLYLLFFLVTLGFAIPSMAQSDVVDLGHGQHEDSVDNSEVGGCSSCHDLSEVMGATDNQNGLKRKISFTKMMMLGKSAKRIEASDDDEANESLAQAKKEITQAETNFKDGDEESAQVLLATAMQLFNKATRLVPSAETLEKLKQQYQQRTAQLEMARLNHHRNFKRMVANYGEAAGVTYDENRVDALTVEAEQQVQQGNYRQAGERLTAAQNKVQGAIRQMMDNQKIVYELDIDTPKKEYAYEFNKYLSYEELIPVAIDSLKPSKGQQMLAKRSSDKGKWMAEQARKKAADGDYPAAIRMVQDATREIRKALKLLGVPDLG